jgi:hypothetical protein
MWSFVSPLLSLLTISIAPCFGLPASKALLSANQDVDLISMVDASVLPPGTDVTAKQKELEKILEDLKHDIIGSKATNPKDITNQIIKWNQDQMAPWLMSSHVDTDNLLTRIETLTRDDEGLKTNKR